MIDFRGIASGRSKAVAAALMLSLGSAGGAAAQDKIQIGLSTKAWFPSFVAQLTQDRGFFKEEGVDAVLTVYASGSEAFTAIAAGSADVISSNPAIIANGRKAGIDAKLVALLATRNFGWQVIAPKDSKIAGAKDLGGKNVGITSAGSNTDLLAQWTQKTFGVTFTTIPLGGGGLVPNLISGNVDAVVVYPPLSYKVVQDGDGKVVLDFSKEMPPHAEAGWAATDSFAAKHPETLRKALKAMFRTVAYIKHNPDEVIPLIAEYDGISESVAKQEYESTFLHLSDDGALNADLVKGSLELFPSEGGAAPDPSTLFTSDFTPVKLTQ